MVVHRGRVAAVENPVAQWVEGQDDQQFRKWFQALLSFAEQAWRAGDFDGYASQFADDVVVESTPTGDLVGRDAAGQATWAMRDRFPLMELEVVAVRAPRCGIARCVLTASDGQQTGVLEVVRFREGLMEHNVMCPLSDEDAALTEMERLSHATDPTGGSQHSRCSGPARPHGTANADGEAERRPLDEHLLAKVSYCHGLPAGDTGHRTGACSRSGRSLYLGSSAA
jgi:hypothetical protein